MNSWKSWLVFAGGVTVYFIGIIQRTSFGIAGVQATERFGLSAAALSVVAVVQIAVYAALQLPVGVLVDRVGPRRLVLVGAAAMAVGQALLAFAPSLPFLVIARMVVGAGDAMTFVSVLRILPTRFEGRILPQLMQWVGMIGGLGQIVSAFPVAFLLASWGWQPTFLAAAGASVVAFGIAFLLVRAGVTPPLTGPIPTESTFRRLRATIARPGTQLGFWSHLTSGHTNQLMGAMWGYPFLTAGVGLSTPVAATVFSLLVIGALIPAPLIGLFVSRFPNRRSDLLLLTTLGIYTVFAIVLLWPGTPPVWMVAVLFFAIGIGGPGSLIGLDFARSFNPSHAVGTASGFANSGGFVGGFMGMLGVGIVLDIVDAVRVANGGASQLYAFDSFRLAFLVPFAITLIGAIAVITLRTRIRRRMRAEEGIEIAPLWVSLFRSWRRKRSVEGASQAVR